VHVGVEPFFFEKNLKIEKILTLKMTTKKFSTR
jgi:hypothetical protein